MQINFKVEIFKCWMLQGEKKILKWNRSWQFMNLEGKKWAKLVSTEIDLPEQAKADKIPKIHTKEKLYYYYYHYL